MRQERWDRVVAIFEEALRYTGEARERFLDEATGADAELRAQIVAMLRADAAAHPLLDATPQALVDAVADPAAPAFEGRRIGPWVLIREIGRGGMGVVYLAERDDPDLAQRAALKLVRAGLDSDELRRRFLHERRIAARLEHPNIARLLDGGISDDGLPFYAMEFVEGVPIDEYCDAHRLDVSARLRLFLDVCAAVQYAHRHLVVHRDLKPSNILVSADGVVKLLDFGIAKVLDDAEEQDARSALTRTGVRPMTPEYASPEQVRGEPVGTATDVYSLGVVLYELLAGRLPYRRRGRPRHEIERAICEEEPERPSTAATRDEPDADAARPTTPDPASPSARATSESVAAARSTRPELLRRRLAGDLDAIVLQALAKEPARRYASVEHLREDVERHLMGLPVRARVPTLAYRAARFVRRHRAGAAAASLAVASLIAFAVVSRAQAERTARERDRAEQVSALLVELFEGADPELVPGDTLTVRGLVERGVARVRSDADLHPEVRARLLRVIANAYENLGMQAEAEALVREVIELRRRALPWDRLGLGHDLRFLATLRGSQGDAAAALALIREAIPLLRAAAGDQSLDMAGALNDEGLALHMSGAYDEALDRYRRALAIRRAADTTSNEGLARTLLNLGATSRVVGDLDAAEQYYREALEVRRSLYDGDHPSLARSMSGLAELLRSRGRSDEAAPLAREALEMRRRVYGAPHPELAQSLKENASLAADLGDVAAADSLYAQSLAMLRALYGDGHGDVARAANDYGSFLNDRGRPEAAEPLLREALDGYVRSLGPRHPFTAVVRKNLAHALHASGRSADALPIYREAIAVLDSAAAAGTVLPSLGPALTEFGEFLVVMRRFEEAEPILRRAYDLEKAALPADHPRVLTAQGVLGVCLIQLRRFAEAEPILLASYRTLSEARGPNDIYTRRNAAYLAVLYERWGKPDLAAPYREAAGAR